jgi:hypothetical protein
MPIHRPLSKIRRLLAGGGQADAFPGGSRLGRPRSQRAIRAAVEHVCEKLESRRLLTTFVGGGVVHGVVQENTYTYLDANQNTIKVALWGTITAEFLFVKVAPNNNTSVVGAVAPTAANITAKAGADLFAIYVASASPTASISIAEENTAANSGNPMEGFAASGQNAITANPAQGGNPIIVMPLANSGAVWIGARSFLRLPNGMLATTPTDGIPILSVPLAMQVGVRPVTADDTLLAGIVTAPGVSLNRIFIGGQLTGRVDLGGSINTFYAGDIWTGDATGLIPGEQPSLASLQHNFNVSGDINNLLALGRIGTEGVSAQGTPDYETGFRLSVSGHIGQVNTQEGVMGSIYAANLPTLKGLGVPQTEEYITGPAPMANSGETFFEGNTPSSDGSEGVPSLADNATFEDDSAPEAQFLGTPFSSAQGHNAVQLEGTLDDTTGVADALDVYAIALGAEQTITATLKAPVTEAGVLQLGILSPEYGNGATSATSLLASTYSAQNPYRLANQSITFTSTDAGVYYFAIGFDGDTNFAGADSVLYGAVDYEFDVTGVKNLGIGAIVAANNIDLTSDVAINQTTGAETSEPSLRADYGDIGAIITTTGGVIVAGDSGVGGEAVALPITATTGSIRVIQTGSIGSEVNAEVGLGPDLDVAGNVGTIRTTAAGGVLYLNPAFDDDVTATGVSNGLSSSAPIGGDYQLIDCAGLFAANLVADGSIGTIRALNVGLTDLAPVLHVNAKNSKTPGDIDLIDVTGTQFGTLSAGGPQIITGPNGNVRYIHIAPGATIYNDNFFGGEIDQPITYAAGATAALTDDSGVPFSIVPYRGQSNVSGDAGAPVTTTNTGTTTGETSTIGADTLTLETYGIEDKGGVVVISVTCTAGTINVTTAGTTTGTTTGTTGVVADGTGPTSISVDTAANGVKDLNGSVDFGSINMVGGGTTLTFTPPGTNIGAVVGAAFTPGPGGANAVAQDDSATFSGKTPINVYDLFATTAAGGGALAGMTNVDNKTSGEIVNFQAQDVQTLEAATLGVASSNVDAPVAGATVYSNVFPFHEQRTLIQIGGTLIGDGATGDPTAGTAGNAVTIESTGALGNILCNGTIGNVLPDVGATRLEGTTEGIVGPIYAASPGGGASPDSGNILNINIGLGLGNSGSGNYATTGIFADNYIGTITNQNGSDIRGDIVSLGDANGLETAVTTTVNNNDGTTTTTTTVTAGTGPYIGAIDLTDGGSIINASILTPTTLAQAIQSTSSSGTGFIIEDPNNGGTNANPADAKFAVGAINLTGNGGIIGTDMLIGGIRSVSVAGFGIIQSSIIGLSDDIVGSISAAGYGIRSCTITGQNGINSIAAVGSGKELKVTSFSTAVRQSESGATVDVYSGQPLDVYNDLDLFLGVNAKSPTRKGSTEAGVIADTYLTGEGGLGSITAWRIVGHPQTAATTVIQQLAQEIDDTPTMTMNFAQSIGKIIVAENTTDLTVTTANIGTFKSGGNVISTRFNVAGEINTVTAGFLSGSTYFNVTGPDGVIGYLATTGGLNASITASADIDEILVGADLGSSNITSGGNLDELYVKGNVLKGANVIVARTIGTLTIRHNLLGGSTIQARAITKRSIGGVANGNIIIVPST